MQSNTIAYTGTPGYKLVLPTRIYQLPSTNSEVVLASTSPDCNELLKINLPLPVPFRQSFIFGLLIEQAGL